MDSRSAISRKSKKKIQSKEDPHFSITQTFKGYQNVLVLHVQLGYAPYYETNISATNIVIQ